MIRILKISSKKNMKKLALAVALCAVIAIMGGCNRDVPPPNEVHVPSDLHGRVIGVVDGSASMRFASYMGTPWFVSNGERLLDDLRAGRVDAAVMEEAAAQSLVARARGVTILPDVLIEYDMRIAVAKENVQLLRAVNSALGELSDNGTLKGLQNKYFGGAEFVYTPPETAGTRTGILTIAVAEDFPPYAFESVVIDEYGVEHWMFAGLDVELARAVADIIGVEYYIIKVPAETLLTAVWFGQADLALGATPWDYDDAESVNFSSAYARSVQVIIVRD